MSTLDENDARYKSLIALGIYELRSLARSVGVQSPTTKKRGELLDYISSKIATGQIERTLPTKQGRPFKDLAGMENIINKITRMPIEEKADEKNLNNFAFGNFLMFAQELPTIQLDNEVSEESKGVLRAGRDILFFKDLNSYERLVYVPKEICTKHKLEVGDMVEGVASKYLTKNEEYLLKYVKKINNTDLKDIAPRQMFRIDETEVIEPHKIVKGYEILEGLRYLRTFSNISQSVGDAKEDIEKLESCGYSVIYIGLNLTIEAKLQIEHAAKGTKFLSLYGDAADIVFNKTIDAISYANLLLKEGKSVVVLIQDFEGLLDMLDAYFLSREGNKLLGHTCSTIAAARQLLGLAKATRKGSITTIASVFDGQLDNEFIRNELLKICVKLK